MHSFEYFHNKSHYQKQSETYFQFFPPAMLPLPITNNLASDGHRHKYYPWMRQEK